MCSGLCKVTVNGEVRCREKTETKSDLSKEMIGVVSIFLITEGTVARGIWGKVVDL